MMFWYGFGGALILLGLVVGIPATGRSNHYRDSMDNLGLACMAVFWVGVVVVLSTMLITGLSS